MILLLQPLLEACCCSVVMADGSTCIGHGIPDYSGRYAPHIGVVGQVGSIVAIFTVPLLMCNPPSGCGCVAARRRRTAASWT